MRAKVIGLSSVVLACAGLFVALSLSLAEARGAIVPCGSEGGCAAVAADPRSQFLGFPVAYFGAAGYVLLILLGVLSAASRFERPAMVLGFLVSLCGTAVGGYLTYYSVTVIHATCPWCLTSAGLMAALLVVYASRLSRPLAKTGALALHVLAAIVLTSAAVGGALFVQSRSVPMVVDMSVLRSMSVSDLVPPGAHSAGQPTAPVTIVEFADFACPACRDIHGRLNKLLHDFVGFRLVYRHLPQADIPGHEASVVGAICSEIASEQGLFWQYANRAFEGPRQPVPADYLQIAVELGVRGIEARLANVNDPAAKRVESDRALCRRLNMRLTPTFILLSPDLPPQVATNLDLLKQLQRPEIARYLRTK